MMSHKISYPYNWSLPPPQYVQPGSYEGSGSVPAEEPTAFERAEHSSTESPRLWSSSSFEMPFQASHDDFEMEDAPESLHDIYTPHASASTPNTHSSAPQSDSARFAAQTFDGSLVPRFDAVPHTPLSYSRRYVPVAPSPLPPVPIARQRLQSQANGILQGLIQSPPLHRRSTFSHQAFPSHPTTHFHHHLPPAGPWNPHNLRSELPQAPLCIHLETPEIAPVRPKKVATRDGPLTSDQSRRAAENRKKGACLRCRLFKETCDGNTPCEGCTKQKRTWTLGCIRGGLDRRYKYLEPELFQAFYTRLGLRRREASLSEHTSTRTFNLHLNFGFDRERPLIVEVRELRPEPSTVSSSYGFRSGQYTEDDIFYDWRQYLDPLVVPVLYTVDKAEEASRLKTQIYTWIKRFLRVPGWKIQRFPCQYHYRLEYPRVVLFFIADYHRDHIPQHKDLRDALILTLLHWTMTLAPEVPLKNAEHLRDWMENGSWWPPANQQSTHTPTKVLPHLVDHAIKSLLHNMIKPHTANLLRTLQELLSTIHRHGGHCADLALSLCLLLLMQASRNQVRIWNESQLPEGAGKWDETNAREMIKEIEKELVEVVVGMANRSLSGWIKAKAAAKGNAIVAARARRVNALGGGGGNTTTWSRVRRGYEEEQEEEDPDVQGDDDETESTCVCRDADTHSKHYGLFDHIIRVSTGDYCNVVKEQEVELDAVDMDNFAVHNAQRLMVKFYRGVF